MSRSDVPEFDELLKNARHTAVHLEMRDNYGVGDEAAGFQHFKRTGDADQNPDSAFWVPWTSLVREAVGRSVVMRRARIVSEPVTDYIRYEHALTPVNLTVGERVRWLPRRQASEIALPGNDFWVFDGRLVQFNHFTGDGDWADPKYSMSEDPAVVKLCVSAFEAVWEQAVDHEKFTV
ncbi:DUF6879 family protein [Streptomyces sp. XD-27]|uniref:DUF6879 family protein n=1 Tax=Streptomyces sp. XD-27 TaxID=3062779 RepID=UPI0026F4369A|nr:DUF6879 family protein [Streptomyces sp. XD-27]WKX70917.1 hypothetical protein Q3Y56_14290 [Streptomyces sp. XD-27]